MPLAAVSRAVRRTSTLVFVFVEEGAFADCAAIAASSSERRALSSARRWMMGQRVVVMPRSVSTSLRDDEGPESESRDGEGGGIGVPRGEIGRRQPG